MKAEVICNKKGSYHFLRRTQNNAARARARLRLFSLRANCAAFQVNKTSKRFSEATTLILNPSDTPFFRTTSINNTNSENKTQCCHLCVKIHYHRMMTCIHTVNYAAVSRRDCTPFPQPSKSACVVSRGP